MSEAVQLFVLIPSYGHEGYGEPVAIYMDETQANAEAERRNKDEPHYGPLWCVKKAPLIKN